MNPSGGLVNLLRATATVWCLLKLSRVIDGGELNRRYKVLQPTDVNVVVVLVVEPALTAQLDTELHTRYFW